MHAAVCRISARGRSPRGPRPPPQPINGQKHPAGGGCSLRLLGPMSAIIAGRTLNPPAISKHRKRSCGGGCRHRLPQGEARCRHLHEVCNKRVAHCRYPAKSQHLPAIHHTKDGRAPRHCALLGGCAACLCGPPKLCAPADAAWFPPLPPTRPKRSRPPLPPSSG